MIIKLPINKNNKILDDNFIVKKINDTILLDTFDSNKYRNLACLNNNSYKGIDIYFPLVFKIHNDIIYNELFFIMSLLYEKNSFNFIYLLEQYIINNFCKKYYFVNFKNITDLKKLCEINKYDNIEYKTIDELLNYTFLKLQYYYNISLCTIYLEQYNIKLNVSKKIISLINKFNSTEILFYGINDIFKNHQSFIKEKNISIKSNSEYFINNNQKLLKVCITKCDHKNIIVNNKIIQKNKYNISKYPSKFNNFINLHNLLYQFISTVKYYSIIDTVFKKNQKMINVSNFFINKSFTNVIMNTNFNLIDEKYKLLTNPLYYCFSDYDFECFKKNITNQSYNEDIYNILINDYTFPFCYNKNSFTEHFKKLIYYFYKFNKDIETMKGYHKLKIKYIHNTLLKIIEYLKTENYNIINYHKIYTDYIFINIFLIIIEENFLNLNENYITNIRNSYFKNMKGIFILHLLSWKYFNKKLNLYSYILNLKNENNNLLFFENKINMNIINSNFDNKLKKVIVDPLYLFNFFKKEKDFVKWVYILRNNLSLFFDNIIKINKNDIKKLGKVIYILTQINEQNLDNELYNGYIKTLKKYDHLIIYNDRINLRIRNILKNTKINLGFLAKHIVSENDSIISLSPNSDDYEDMSKKLQYMTNRYYKYKGKYISLKMSDLSSNINE